MRMIAPFKRLGPVARNVGRNLGWMLASRGVAAVLSLVYLSIVTRALGLVDFGRFALITGTAQILTTLVAFQSWQIVIQYGVEPARRGDEKALARLFLGSTVLEFAGALVGVVLAAVIVYVWGDALGIGPTLKRATLIFAIVQLLTIRSTAVGMLRLRDHFNLGAIADSMTPVGRFVGSGLVLLIHPTLQGFLVAWGFAELLTAGTYWWFAARAGDVGLMKRAGRLRGLIRDHPGIVGFALSTNANSTLGLASKQIPLLLVGGISGPAAAGAFRLAAQISQALAKISQMVARAAFPEMVRSVQTLTTSAIGTFIRRLFVGSAIAVAIIMTLVFLVGQQVLTLVGGRGFASAWPIMVWLAAAGCFDLIAVGIETVLTALRRAATVFVVRSMSVLVILGTAYVLAQSMGGVGVAIAVSIGAGAASVMMAICAFGLKIDTPAPVASSDDQRPI